MIVHQFYDKGLAHGSYAIISNDKMIVIDPARDPQPYYDFAKEHNSIITGVIETHPHADFISSHLEIHQTTGANIYVSKLTGAGYPHSGFDDGDVITLDDIKLKAINTPGHSPDSICILVADEQGKPTTIFTGDTLFVGDVGRPDLRENAGNVTAKKEELARQMFHSTREKLMTLPHDVVVYPAHGPGSLCGKSISPNLQSTIGQELRENYALQLMDELTFVKTLTAEQSYIPKYFGFDVELNKNGAAGLRESIHKIFRPSIGYEIDDNLTLIDTRLKTEFIKGHIKGAINLQNGEKFETWLGSIVNPDESFYLIATDASELEILINKVAKIGYEGNIKAALFSPRGLSVTSPDIDLAQFESQPENFTVVDVRNQTETAGGLIFKNAIAIPLSELRERLNEIPINRPIVVHCAAGYRSAAATSIIAAKITTQPIYDLSDAITDFISSKHPFKSFR